MATILEHLEHRHQYKLNGLRDFHSSEVLFAGFFRGYDLTLQSNFGDGLMQQRENRTVAGSEAAYLAKLGHGLNLMIGADVRRDAPRNLDLKHLDQQGLFDLMTSNTPHAVAMAGQSHGRVVVARSAPEILSAGDTKRKGTSNFAAFRRQEHTQKSAPR